MAETRTAPPPPNRPATTPPPESAAPRVERNPAPQQQTREGPAPAAVIRQMVEVTQPGIGLSNVSNEASRIALEIVAAGGRQAALERQLKNLQEQVRTGVIDKVKGRKMLAELQQRTNASKEEYHELLAGRIQHLKQAELPGDRALGYDLDVSSLAVEVSTIDNMLQAANKRQSDGTLSASDRVKNSQQIKILTERKAEATKVLQETKQARAKIKNPDGTAIPNAVADMALQIMGDTPENRVAAATNPIGRLEQVMQNAATNPDAQEALAAKLIALKLIESEKELADALKLGEDPEERKIELTHILKRGGIMTALAGIMMVWMSLKAEAGGGGQGGH